MDDSVEEKEVQREREVIIDEFNAWNRILEEKDPSKETNFIQEIEERQYEFHIDRSEDDHSFVTADAVGISLLLPEETLEEFLGLGDEFSPTQEGERWIVFDITPRDPYNSPVGFWDDKLLNGRKYRGFTTEALHLYISSQGRAYEDVEWDVTGKPDETQLLSRLKKLPDEEQAIRLEKEPIRDQLIVPLNKISGASLERLLALRKKIARRKTLEDEQGLAPR